MKIGIDKIAMHIPNFYLDIRSLARARGVEEDKFVKGLLQNKMAINHKSQDPVTMGALAALKILDKDDKEKIDMIIVGSETGVDQSKSIAAFLHSILGINKFCRSIEIKQACYGATAAIQYAKNHIMQNENSKVLVIASDIAKYGKNTAGESTQGAGAIAMLISKDPKILEISDKSVCYTEDVMDFFRPNNSNYAIAYGKFSTEVYLKSLEIVYEEFMRRYKEDIAAICFHIPFPKLGLKALKLISDNEKHYDLFEKSIVYNKEVGNIYTGSMFLSFLSLIENAKTLKKGDVIAFYSYGSGAVCEFLTGTLVEGFDDNLLKKYHKDLLANRKELSVEEYEEMFFANLDEEENYENLENQKIYLKGIFNRERKYENG